MKGKLPELARLVEEIRRTNPRHSASFGDPSANSTRKERMSKISTRLTIFGACIAAIAGLMASMAGAAAAATTCTPTGLFRDGNDLTAALITRRRRARAVNANGCDIGVYYGPGTPARSTAPISDGATTTASSSMPPP